MLNTRFSLYIVFVAAMIMAGCANNYGGNQYSGRQVRSVQTVDYGTVTSVNQVQIDSDNPAIIGPLGGAVVGGLLGNMVGHGRGRRLATIGGALGGAAAGYGGEKFVTTSTGIEIGVRLDNGQELSIVQGGNESFVPGERVRILRAQDGSARVTR